MIFLLIRSIQAISFGALINHMKGAGDPICLLHIMSDTTSLMDYRQFYFNLNSQQIFDRYLKTYTSSAKTTYTTIPTLVDPRIPLNQRPASQFGGYDDIYLFRRFSEFTALSQCNQSERLLLVSNMNTRNGKFQIPVFSKSRTGKFNQSFNFFIAFNPDQKALTLVLPASRTDEDRILDLDAVAIHPTIQITKQHSSDFMVHRGFYKHFMKYREEIHESIQL